MNKTIIFILLIKIIMMVNAKFESFTRITGNHNESMILRCSDADEPDQYQWYQVIGNKFSEMSSDYRSMNIHYIPVLISCEYLQVFGCRYANTDDFGYDVFTVQCSDKGQQDYLKQKMNAHKLKFRGKQTTKKIKIRAL